MNEHEILQELECPICFTYMKPPIRMCVTGHSICDVCRNELTFCPICESQFATGRNVALESIAHRVKYPCMYSEKGCTKIATFHEHESHEPSCKFRGINCPQEACSFNGEFSDLVAHCKSEHTPVTPLHPNMHFDFISFTISNGSSANVLIKTHDEYFWFRGKVIEEDVWLTVQMLGKREDASKYKYKFLVTQGDRKTCFEDVCRSIETADDDVFTNVNSCSLNLRLSQFYASNSWSQYLTIEKVKGSSLQTEVANNFGYKFFLLIALFAFLYNLEPNTFDTNPTGKMKHKHKTSFMENLFLKYHLVLLMIYLAVYLYVFYKLLQYALKFVMFIARSFLR